MYFLLSVKKRMAITMPDDIGSSLHKGLSEWWSEETEYVFQRIERWAAYARGYNRLRSQRLSRGRMTMQEEHDPRWRISSNKLVIDDTSWSPRFHTLKRSRRRSRPEELKINCCGTFDYQSSSNLDSTCLETYRYDHSIYFKTIGDIRRKKKNHSDKDEEDDRVSISSEELVEWDAEEASEYISSHFGIDNLFAKNFKNNSEKVSTEDDIAYSNSISWPIVDFTSLQIQSDETADELFQENQRNERSERNDNNVEESSDIIHPEAECDNNNYIINKSEENTVLENDPRTNNNPEEETNKENERKQDSVNNYLSFPRTRDLSQNTNELSLVVDNGVGWMDTLLNPLENIDAFAYPAYYNVLQV